MYEKLGKGLYSFTEAARLTRLKRTRVREWFRSKRGPGPIFSGDFEDVEGDCAISFFDLVDVFIAGQMREHGVPLQTLRKVYARLSTDFDAPHSFCRVELRTDGKIVFMRGVDELGREELEEVLTRQKVFPQIIRPFLKQIDYDEATRLALRWHIAQGIVVDPAISFGKPIVEDVGISTNVLAAAYEANGRNAELVADWYDVHSSHVIAATKFENSLSA